jgi:patatin-like phospholipase/acyl hydrolase
MILCELEKRCHKHLSDVFNMFVGTSSGAVICSCLVVSDNSLVPLYTASHPLEMLVNKSNRIFPNPSNIRQIFSEKFTTKTTYDVCNETFKNYRLSQTLCDLIVPAVKCDGPLRTVYFTNYEAKKSTEKDFLLNDVLMSTTAAPTYFPPYRIHELGMSQ